MSNGQPLHVCFQSNRCRWSEAFIKALAQTPQKSEIRFVCVDPGADGQRPKLPGWIKKVPTLVVRGEDEPRTDANVMNWLSERKLLAKGAPGSGEGDAAEPEPWISGEMGGSLTKGFSFLGANDTNDAPMGNFEFLGGASAPGTRTASDIPGGGLGARAQNKSKKEEMFDKQMEQYMLQRNSGVNMPPRRQ